MKYIAQAVMSIILWMPNSARGRPELVLAKEDVYARIFDPKSPRDMFFVCVLLDRQVYTYLTNTTGLNFDVIADIRYYVDAVIGSILTGHAHPTPEQISKLSIVVKAQIEPSVLEEATNMVLGVYKTLGGNDKIAKGPDMKEKLLASLGEQYPEDGKNAA
jgi:hypothetical protein